MSTQSEESQQSSLAILFDADNTSHSYVKKILDACAPFGKVTIKRAYGDWTEPNLHEWVSVFREFSIKPIQQFRFTIGKNVTDSAMIIDAMDILHSRRVSTFVLASSDSDFTALATRIREEGLHVIGIGRSITPPTFVNACDKFLYIENLVGQDEEKAEEKGEENAIQHPTSTLSPILYNRDQGRDLLVRAVRVAADENGHIKGALLGLTLRRLDPSFDPKNYGVMKLADFIELYPDVLKILGRRISTDPTYKSQS